MYQVYFFCCIGGKNHCDRTPPVNTYREGNRFREFVVVEAFLFRLRCGEERGATSRSCFVTAGEFSVIMLPVEIFCVRGSEGGFA